MPYKSEKMRVVGTKYDRRVKLTDDQKREIVELYAEGTIGCLALAKRYGVSKRLIQFILHPDRMEANRQRLKEYKDEHRPTKEELARTMREHRRYKQELYLKGEIG